MAYANGSRPCYTGRADVATDLRKDSSPCSSHWRVASLETTGERHEQTIARLVSIAENQDQLLDRLLTNQEATARLLEEVIHDAATTRRLWLHLAQRYGWLDDEQMVPSRTRPHKR